MTSDSDGKHASNRTAVYTQVRPPPAFSHTRTRAWLRACGIHSRPCHPQLAALWPPHAVTIAALRRVVANERAKSSRRRSSGGGDAPSGPPIPSDAASSAMSAAAAAGAAAASPTGGTGTTPRPPERSPRAPSAAPAPAPPSTTGLMMFDGASRVSTVADQRERAQWCVAAYGRALAAATCKLSAPPPSLPVFRCVVTLCCPPVSCCRVARAAHSRAPTRTAVAILMWRLAPRRTATETVSDEHTVD